MDDESEENDDGLKAKEFMVVLWSIRCVAELDRREDTNLPMRFAENVSLNDPERSSLRGLSFFYCLIEIAPHSAVQRCQCLTESGFDPGDLQVVREQPGIVVE